MLRLMVSLVSYHADIEKPFDSVLTVLGSD